MKKLKLDQIKVSSFITKPGSIKAGSEIDLTDFTNTINDHTHQPECHQHTKIDCTIGLACTIHCTTIQITGLNGDICQQSIVVC